MRAQLVAVVLLSSMAQAQQIVDVQSARLLQADGGTLEVTGGVWLPDEELIRQAREHRDLAARNQYLQEHVTDMPTVWLLGALVLGGAIGAVSGYFVGQAVKR